MSYFINSYPSTGSSTTSITSSTSVALLVPRNDNRQKFICSMTGSTTCYLGFTSSVTSQSFVVYMQSGDVFSDSNWKGPIYTLFSSQSSATFLSITEFNG